ncbi:hypothetical protein OCU04_000182 [Sclerotinia nivalis]|uniref:Wax synthase domain-containing protein n=1 Tax=Sclerotinia nivalis TaxID=352851 RepID=A0A9X0AYZ4_9HELO|nr:hypothetical protein OCU04_000182 [Sclerotinia nivalis]
MAIQSGVPNTTLREPESSVIPHILLFVCQFVALALFRFSGRRPFFCIAIIVLAIWAHFHPHFTNNIALAQPFTIAWSYYMNTLAKLIFSGEEGPEAHYWRIDKPPKEAISYAAFGIQKLRWAIMLVFNQRGIRWNFQIKNVPASPKESRGKFLIRQALQFGKCMFIADLLFELTKHWIFTPSGAALGELDSKYLTLWDPDLRWSFAKALVFGSTPYFMLSMQYAQFAFLAVLLGLSKPEDWPSPFGRLADVTTVRDFWGVFWHQQLRSMLTMYTDGFANYFGIPRGTNISSYTKLYIAFSISGIFHALSQLQMPCPTNITPAERTLGFFLFFVWQMAAITFEDFVQWMIPKPIGGRWRKVVGYLWVVASFWASMWLAADTFLRMRMGAESFLPLSFWAGIVESYFPVPH